MLSPQGDTVAIDAADIPNARAAGYRDSSTDETAQFNQARAHYNKYGKGIGNELKAAALGAGRGFTFGLSDAALAGSGALGKADIAGYQQENPTASALGETAGVVGSTLLLPGGGPIGLAGHAAEAATEGLGRGVAATVARAGIRGAAESIPFTTGSLISEATLGDPAQVAEHALQAYGQGALTFGALGALGEGGVQLVRGGVRAAQKAVGAAMEAAPEAYAHVSGALTGQGGEDAAELFQAGRNKATEGAIKLQARAEQALADTATIEDPVARKAAYESSLDTHAKGDALGDTKGLSFSDLATLATSAAGHLGLGAAVKGVSTMVEAGRLLLDPTEAGLKFGRLEMMVQDANALIDKHIDAATSLASRGAAIGSRISAVANQVDTYQKRVADIQKLAQPENLMAHAEALSAPFQFSPGLATSMSMNVGNQVNYLQGQIKSPTMPGMFPRPWTPSATEAQDYNLKHDAVVDPVTALGRGLVNGNLTPQTVMAVQATAPLTLQKFQAKALSKLTGMKQPHAIPYNRHGAFSLLLGKDVFGNMSPTMIQGVQAVYALKATQQGGVGSRPRPAQEGKITISQQMLTPTQRAAQRAEE